MLIDLLKTGKLSFEGIQIPVLTYLKSRLTLQEDLKVALPFNQLSEMTSFSTLKECVVSRNREKINENISYNLQDAMLIEFGNDAEYAAQLFSSFKQIVLQQLMIGSFQFMFINTITCWDESDVLVPSFRERFLKIIEDKLFVPLLPVLDFKDPNNTYKTQLQTDFKKDLKSALRQSFFLVDHENPEIKISNNRFNLKYHEGGLKINGKLQKYNDFMHQRRLYFYDKGAFIPTDSFQNFQERLLLYRNQLLINMN